MATTKILIVGGTGMVGGLALRDALARDEVAEVVGIGRRSTGVDNARYREIIHSDYMDYRGVAEAFDGVDIGLFCIGAYSGALPDEEFKRVTVDYAMAFGRALHAGRADATLCFLSGAGADPSGQSRMAFARYKGEAERGLAELGLGRLHVFRPGYIYPVTPRQEPNFSYRAMRAMWPLMRAVYPNGGIPSDELAQAMVHAGLHGTSAHQDPVLENRDIRAFVKTWAS